MSLLCLNHVHSQGWIDVSVDTNYAFNSIEYIHEIDEFFVGGIGGVYRWDYQDWEWQQVYGAQDNSVYNNGLLGINKTVLICYSLLDENFENWYYYEPGYRISDLVPYQDKIIILPKETYDNETNTNIYGFIMSNSGDIVDSLHLSGYLFDTSYAYKPIKFGFSVDDEVFLVSHADNFNYDDVTFVHKTSDLGLTWEEVAIFSGPPIDAKAEDDVVAIAFDANIHISNLVKSYDGFETWELEELNAWSYISSVDINNGTIYCAGLDHPDGSLGFIYDGSYTPMDDFIKALSVEDIGTMVAGYDGYVAFNYNYTDIEESILENKDQIKCYPNPFTDIIHVSVEKNTLVQVFDVRACLVDEFYGQRADLSALNVGVYVLKVNDRFIKVIKR